MKNKTRILGVLMTVGLFAILAFKPVNDKKVIVIDAGHGGHDFGAAIVGFDEKSIVEAISKKVKALNKDENIEIVLLREGDRFMELSERVSIINNLKPDLVISLHINSSTNLNSNGVDVYVSSNKEFNAKSKDVAEKLFENVAGKNLMKRKVSEAPFYILKNTKCPVALIELGYLSNDDDRYYITSEDGQNEIASKILESVK